jgi:hypothetical protein
VANQPNKSKSSNSGPRARLTRCRQLLDRLNPDRPPPTVRVREFRWQCRALRERTHLYAERLAKSGDPDKAVDSKLQRAEFAVDLSLRYFQDVLTPKSDSDDESSRGPRS